MKRIAFLALILLFLTACIPKTTVYSNPPQDQAKAVVPSEVAVSVPAKTGTSASIPAEKPTATQVPEKIDLPVAFASQAPLGNWDLPYQESCEEAALITASKYFYNEPLSNEIMDAEIKKLVAWENQRFGFYTDTTIAEVQIMAKEYFKLKTAIVVDPTVDSIKSEIAKGNLVLTPTAGRLLYNPNFKGEGPLYHFLVVRGYNSSQFIMNDVGTRKGNGYTYNYAVLLSAIHDLPLKADGTVLRPFDDSSLTDSAKGEMMTTGAKKALVVSGKLE